MLLWFDDLLVNLCVTRFSFPVHREVKLLLAFKVAIEPFLPLKREETSFREQNVIQLFTSLCLKTCFPFEFLYSTSIVEREKKSQSNIFKVVLSSVLLQTSEVFTAIFYRI